MNLEIPFNMLLVEDDPGDQKLVKSALSAQDVKINLHIASCAEDALKYLQLSENGDVDCPWPNLIVLDLNMPGMGGKEFLTYIKAEKALCSIPVVILTTSDSEADIKECYGMYAAGYIQKPGKPAEFRNIVRNMITYWFTDGLSAKHHLQANELEKVGGK